MPEIVSDLSPSSLAVAIKANLYAFFASFRRSSVATVEEDAYGFRWRTPIPHSWFNGLLCTRPPGNDAAALVRNTVASFQAHGVDGFTWWLAPEVEPGPWSAHLLANGFHYDDQTPGMAIDLAALPPLAQTTLTIQPVTELAELAEWTDTFLRGYGIPAAIAPDFVALASGMGIDLPFRYYLGRQAGKAVATSTLLLGAGVAGIYSVATVSEARGQGIGSAMTLFPLYEARNLGYRVGVLQSSDMGFRVYQRLGFAQYCRMDHFYWAAPRGDDSQ